jgi:hypothetical protein
MMRRFLIFVALLFLPEIAYGQCAGVTSCTALSAGSTDVQNALNSINLDNTTLTIPNQTVQWTATVTYNQSFSTTIVGGGNTTGSDSLGNPTGYNDQTVIQDLVSNSNNQTFTINTASGKTFRMTGVSILFTSSQTTARNSGVIGIVGHSHSIRIDHNHFSGGICCRLINVSNADVWGVVDHNYFNITNGINVNLVEVNGAGWNGSSDNNGDVSWNDLDYFGTNKFLFFEDNTLAASNGGSNGTTANIDIEQGARTVFRYNTLSNVAFQTHGIGHGAQDRGPRAWEVYKNSFSSGQNGYSQYSFVTDYEGGTSLYWGNTITNWTNFIRPDYRRASGDTYAQTATPNGWGYCGSLQTGPNGTGPSNWDQNLDSSGQACLDGVGRGKGDLLTGSFPNACDSTLGCSTFNGQWLNQVRSPVYLWNNTLTTVTNYLNIADPATANNRDVFVELPNINNAATFAGTAGIGSGTLTPTTAGAYTGAPNCSNATYPGPGYWDTTNNTLYVCTAANTWTSYYTPYTYPHPLTGASSSTWGTMDMWLQMNTSSPGTTLTPTILANGTVSGTAFTWQTCVGSGSCSNTTSSAFTVAASQGGMGGSITVNGTTYPVGTTTQTLALSPGTSFVFAETFSPPSGHQQVVANGYYTAGTAVTNNMDLLGLWDVNGNWAVMQAQASGGVAIETGQPTARSSTIALTAGHRYAFSLLFDEINGLGKLAMFDPSNGYAQVGSTVTSVMPTGSVAGNFYLGHISIGNSETGSSSSTIYFEDLMIDWTSHIFPNVPQASSSSATPGFVSESGKNSTLTVPLGTFSSGVTISTSTCGNFSYCLPFAEKTLAGNLGIVAFQYSNGGSTVSSTVTDDAPGGSNTWTCIGSSSQSSNKNLNMCYAPNLKVNTHKVTIGFAGTAVTQVQADVAQFFNINQSAAPAPLSASNTVVGTSSTTMTGPTLATGVNDLVYAMFCRTGTPNMTSGVFTPGSGFNPGLIKTQRGATSTSDGCATEWMVSTNGGNVTPTMTMGTASTYIVFAAAFKASVSSAGTAPTAPYLQRMMSWSSQSNTSDSSTTFQFPSGSGDLLVMTGAGATNYLGNSITDSGNSWALAGQCQQNNTGAGNCTSSGGYSYEFYKTGAAANTTNTQTVNFTGSGDVTAFFYDFVGTFTFNTRSQFSSNSNTTNVLPVNPGFSFNPGSTNALTIAIGPIAFNTAISVTSPSGTAVNNFDGGFFGGESIDGGGTPESIIDQNNIFSHSYTSVSGALNWQWGGDVHSSPNNVGVDLISFTTTAGPPPTAQTPTFSPAAGTYSSAQTVTITNPSGTPVMCYTTNGNTPATNGATGCTTGTVYSSAITVSTTETVKAVAGGTGWTDSAVGSAAYTITAGGNCPSPTSVGTFTFCSSAYNDVTSSTTSSVSLSPFAGNGVEVFVQYCGNANCNVAPTQTIVSISDNINNPETCFVQAPHSPYALANVSVPDYETVGAFYCPSIPSGVTTLTVTTSATASYLQIDAVEWKVGSISPTNFFSENVDALTNSGAVAGTTATVTTSGPTVNSNDLITASIVTCGASIPGIVGTGYTGIIVNPATTPGHITEAMAANSAGVQTATMTWTATQGAKNCNFNIAGSNDTWFGVIVPLSPISSPSNVTITIASDGAGSTHTGTAMTTVLGYPNPTGCVTNVGTSNICYVGSTLVVSGSLCTNVLKCTWTLADQNGDTLPASSQLIVATDNATYTSGINATGSIGQTCLLSGFDGGGVNATATVSLTGTNTIASGTALLITNTGSNYTSAPANATVANGSATCTAPSGTATISTTLYGQVTPLGQIDCRASSANTTCNYNAPVEYPSTQVVTIGVTDGTSSATATANFSYFNNLNEYFTHRGRALNVCPFGTCPYSTIANSAASSTVNVSANNMPQSLYAKVTTPVTYQPLQTTFLNTLTSNTEATILTITADPAYGVQMPVGAGSSINRPTMSYNGKWILWTTASPHPGGGFTGPITWAQRTDGSLPQPISSTCLVGGFKLMMEKNQPGWLLTNDATNLKVCDLENAQNTIAVFPHGMTNTGSGNPEGFSYEGGVNDSLYPLKTINAACTPIQASCSVTVTTFDLTNCYTSLAANCATQAGTFNSFIGGVGMSSPVYGWEENGTPHCSEPTLPSTDKPAPACEYHYHDIWFVPKSNIIAGLYGPAGTTGEAIFYQQPMTGGGLDPNQCSIPPTWPNTTVTTCLAPNTFTNIPYWSHPAFNHAVNYLVAYSGRQVCGSTGTNTCNNNTNGNGVTDMRTGTSGFFSSTEIVGHSCWDGYDTNHFCHDGGFRNNQDIVNGCVNEALREITISPVNSVPYGRFGCRPEGTGGNANSYVLSPTQSSDATKLAYATWDSQQVRNQLTGTGAIELGLLFQTRTPAPPVSVTLSGTSSANVQWTAATLNREVMLYWLYKQPSCTGTWTRLTSVASVNWTATGYVPATQSFADPSPPASGANACYGLTSQEWSGAESSALSNVIKITNTNGTTFTSAAFAGPGTTFTIAGPNNVTGLAISQKSVCATACASVNTPHAPTFQAVAGGSLSGTMFGAIVYGKCIDFPNCNNFSGTLPSAASASVTFTSPNQTAKIFGANSEMVGQDAVQFYMSTTGAVGSFHLQTPTSCTPAATVVNSTVMLINNYNVGGANQTSCTFPTYNASGAAPPATNTTVGGYQITWTDVVGAGDRYDQIYYREGAAVNVSSELTAQQYLIATPPVGTQSFYDAFSNQAVAASNIHYAVVTKRMDGTRSQGVCMTGAGVPETCGAGTGGVTGTGKISISGKLVIQ